MPLGFSGQYDDNLQVPSLLGDHSLQLQPLRAPPHRHLHDLLPQPAPDGFKNSFEQAERKPFPALGKEEKEARRAGVDESQSADVSVDAWVSVFVFLMLVKYACSSKITETQGDISEKCQTLFGVSVCTFKSLT